MTTIRLLDARRGLYRKCEELVGDAKIAEAIYRFLCDGIEECEDAEPERKKGHWFFSDTDFLTHCSNCGQSEWKGYCPTPEEATEWMPICPKCGADMREEAADADT